MERPDLFHLVRAGRLDSLAVVGTARGVGKTVAVEHLVRRAQEEGITPGLVAGGREDEPLAVPRGILVATAARALRQGEAYVEVLEVLPVAGPQGPLTVARVREPGRLSLVGPQTASGLGAAVKRLRAHGAALVVVDGSLDRVASAAPLVTAGTVVATGAAVGGGVREVAERTRLLLTFLGLPEVDDGRLRDACLRAARQWKVAAVDPAYQPFSLSLKTALGSGGAMATAVDKGVRALVVAGALVDGVVEALAGLREAEVRVVVPDGTHVFLGSRAWARFSRAGGTLSVLHPIRVTAVTLNPFGPDGVTLDPGELLEEVARVAHLPVFDLVLNRARNLA